MREAFMHFLRYVGWAGVGAVLGLSLLFIWFERGDSHYFVPSSLGVALVAIPGALALVLIRAGVGVVTGAVATSADRATAGGVGRCVLGGAAAWLLADFVHGFVNPWEFQWLNELGWWLLPIVLAGACAGLATGWLAWRRHARVVLPVSWLLVFILLTSGWLALAEKLLDQRKRHRSTHSAALKLCFPHVAGVLVA